MPIAPEWNDRLAATVTRDDVVQAARAFVESRPWRSRRRLPHELRAFPMERAEDVTAYALLLMQHEFACQGAAATDYYELLSFFAAATQRLAHIGTGRFTRKE